MLAESLENAFAFISRNRTFILLVWLVSTLITTLVGLLDLTSFKDNSFVIIIITFAGAFCNIWLFVSMIYRIKRQEFDYKTDSIGLSLKEGFFSTPGYILVAIGYTLLMVMGLFFLIIPGIYLGAIFVFAPTLSVLDMSGDRSTFSHSKKLLEGNFMIGFLFAILSILLEISSQLIMTIGQNFGIPALFNIPAFAIFMAIGILVEVWSTFTVLHLLKKEKIKISEVI